MKGNRSGDMTLSWEKELREERLGEKKKKIKVRCMFRPRIAQ